MFLLSDPISLISSEVRVIYEDQQGRLRGAARQLLAGAAQARQQHVRGQLRQSTIVTAQQLQDRASHMNCGSGI